MAERIVLRTVDQLNALKAARGAREDLSELHREQVRQEKAVRAALAGEPKTVPEIAAETGIDAQQVFWMINALRKYNKAASVGKRGDYTTYVGTQ
jgi:predicted Rossmann fold nucleotide-binding protein DprA/Smf involved in DNA uptake